MDIWEKLYRKAKEEYKPREVSPFIYAHHVVCALESEDGRIYQVFALKVVEELWIYVQKEWGNSLICI